MKSTASNRSGLLGYCVAFAMGLCTLGVVWFAWSLWNPESRDLSEVPRELADESDRTESQQLAEPKTDSASSALAGTPAATLEELTLIDGEFSRGLALYNFALNVDETDILDLIAQTENLPSRFQFGFQKALVHRLYEINPELALSHVENSHDGLVQLLYRDLARKDLTGAIARAKSLEGETLTQATLGILSPHSEFSAEQRAEIARELGREDLSTSMARGEQVSVIRQDPEKAWNDALRESTFDSNHIRTLVISAVTWLSQSGSEAFDEISASLENVPVREQVLASVFASATEFMDFEVVFQKALEVATNQDLTLLSSVIGSWTQSDPVSALGSVNDVESYSLRNQLQRMVVHTWAYNDPRSMLDELDRIPMDLQATAREDALTAIAQRDPREAITLAQNLEPGVSTTALVSKIASLWAEQDPQAALAWALNVQEFSSSRSQLISSVVRGWSNREPNAALNWILENREYAEVRDSTIASVLRNLADENPDLALQRALEQPIDKDRAGLVHAVISYVAHEDLQLAREMLRHVREGDTRRNAYAAVGLAMVHASRGNEALDLASNLPDSERASYVRQILRRWVSTDALGLFDALSNISDSEIQSSAADALIRQDRTNDILTDEQVEYVRQYKSESDEEIITIR
ncbi:MAG: hypothetical protein OXG08_00455 [Gammaproteobacteria bacterium]|nr:hypothetical protein [Gammaproteobacteria bacterium]